MTQENECDATVSLVKASPSKAAILEALTRALELIRFEVSPPINSVIIKPNLCYYWHASTGYTTDPKVIESLIDYLREKLGGVSIKIAEADATAMRTKHSFRMLGYTKLAKAKRVDLVNLSTERAVDKRITVNKREIVFKVPVPLLDADFLINVPKLKVMKATKITCALKNIFGCIATPRKAVYHPILDEAIVGINKILHPHLTLVDGLVGLGSSPVKLNLLIASTNPFATDYVAAQIMGYNPSSVEFLKIAKDEKLLHPKRIIVVGQEPKQFRRLVPRHGFMASAKEDLQLKLLKAYCRLTGDVLPPIVEATE